MATVQALAMLLLLGICSCSNRAGNALDEARKLAAQGKYAEALQRHIWFHEHALEVDSSYSGVRLSFALSDWLELGMKYPKALDALKGIRTQKAARLLTVQADRGLFQDVAAINEHLVEAEATVELFKKIDVAQPQFAAEVYDLADKALLDAREFALARKHLGDPWARLNTAKGNFDSGMLAAKALLNNDVSRRAFQNIFTEEVLRIVKVLDETGDRDLARQIQSTALTVLPSTAIRDALENLDAAPGTAAITKRPIHSKTNQPSSTTDPRP